jgi:hypothetical protein
VCERGLPAAARVALMTSSDSKRGEEGGGCRQCRGQREEQREYLRMRGGLSLIRRRGIILRAENAPVPGDIVDARAGGVQHSAVVIGDDFAEKRNLKGWVSGGGNGGGGGGGGGGGRREPSQHQPGTLCLVLRRARDSCSGQPAAPSACPTRHKCGALGHTEGCTTCMCRDPASQGAARDRS